MDVFLALNDRGKDHDQKWSFFNKKNAEGLDSPEVTRKMLSDRAKAWLKLAGVEVNEDAVIDMSPMFAICPEDAAAKKDELVDMSKPGNYVVKYTHPGSEFTRGKL